jgi:hypothetical protein
VIIVQGNGIVKIILVNKQLGMKTRRPQIHVCYALMEGLIDEEEDLIFQTKLKLFLIGTITILDEMVSLPSVGVIEIRINGESKLE